jgi:lipoprotein-releasing system ATP-binding protein
VSSASVMALAETVSPPSARPSKANAIVAVKAKAVAKVEPVAEVESTPPAPPLFQMVELTKQFQNPSGDSQVICRSVTRAIRAGITGLIGPSGLGKSTILTMLGGLDVPTEGAIFYRGNPIPYDEPVALQHYLRRVVGWIHQNDHLVDHQTAEENAAMPRLLRGESRPTAIREARDHMAALGIEEKQFQKLPGQLSCGMRQRVSIARAFTADTEVLLADEPTSSLDEVNARTVMQALADRARKFHKSVVIVSHDVKLVREFADRVIDWKELTAS